MSCFPSAPVGKKTPYYKYKEMEKHKKLKEEDESAKVYQDFVESFEVHPSGETETEFVRGETILHGTEPEEVQEEEEKQTITFLTEKPKGKRSSSFASAFQPPPPPLPVEKPQPQVELPIRKTERSKPRHIDLMLETIKREQEMRESRSRPRHSGFDAMTERSIEPAFSGSILDGDGSTTNLYVGNLAPDLNEEILKREFGRFGPVASVKIMWPRDEDQIKRGSNVGFVAFMNRESAAKCIEKLNGEKLHGMELRIGWGKSVPLPSVQRPGAIPSVEAILPTMASESLSLNVKKGSSIDDVIEVTIPEDLHLRYVIDTLAAFVVKDGMKFEQLVRQTELDNPAFAFLFEDGSPANVYYRWKLFTLVQGDSMTRWRLEPFYMIEGGPKWKPPNMCVGDGSQLTAAQRGEGIMKRRLLSDLERKRFEDILRDLKADKSSICEAMVFALHNAEAAEEVVEMLEDSLRQIDTPVTVKIARLFVVSDILHNSSASVRNASQYRTQLQDKLPDIFESFQMVYNSLHDKKDIQESIKRYVLRILRVWRNWYIFSNDYLNGLQSTFLVPLQTEEQILVYLKKLEGVSSDEMERKCRFNGLSLEGGIEEQKRRFARLEAYLYASTQSPPQKKQKTKQKRQTALRVPKRDGPLPRKLPAEPKPVIASSWVSVERESEKKPNVPISQWLQEKLQRDIDAEPQKSPVHISKKPSKPGGVENPDFDMFEADDQ